MVFKFKYKKAGKKLYRVVERIPQHRMLLIQAEFVPDLDEKLEVIPCYITKCQGRGHRKYKEEGNKGFKE